MPSDEGPSDEGTEHGGKPTAVYIDGIEETDRLTDTDSETLSLTPQQHERLKEHLHGDDPKGKRLDELTYTDRRYLVVGRGGDDGPGSRRTMVRDVLDDRRDAVAFRLEDFGLTPDEIDLWAPAFDILCQQATHVIGILEDYDGGHVWELGFLYHQQSRIHDVLWLLKRIYKSNEKQREKYDNGMAASHLAALEKTTTNRVLQWKTVEELRRAITEIP